MLILIHDPSHYLYDFYYSNSANRASKWHQIGWFNLEMVVFYAFYCILFRPIFWLFELVASFIFLLDTSGPADVGLRDDNQEDDRGHGFLESSW